MERRSEQDRSARSADAPAGARFSAAGGSPLLGNWILGGFGCIAVFVVAHLAEENEPPVPAFFAGDSELERRLACGVA